MLFVLFSLAHGWHLINGVATSDCGVKCKLRILVAVGGMANVLWCRNRVARSSA